MHDTFLIFDIETLDTIPTSAVLAISLIVGSWAELNDADNPTDYLRHKGITFRLDTKQQVTEQKRTVSRSTLRWWKKYPEAYDIVTSMGEKIDSADLYDRIKTYIKESDYSYYKSFIWIRGPHFDEPIMLNFFTQYNDIEGCPWNQWKIRDIRTVLDLAETGINGYLNDENGNKIIERLGTEYEFIKHDSMSDCILDILQLNMVLFDNDE